MPHKNRHIDFRSKSINWFNYQWAFTEMCFWIDLEKNDKMNTNWITSGQKNKFSQSQKLPRSRMGKYISQIKFSPLPNCKGKVKFHFWINFTSYFTFSCLIFIRVWYKEDKIPLFRFRHISPIHPCYYHSPIIRHGRGWGFFCMICFSLDFALLKR